MEELIPITPSTGGLVSPQNIVGRNKEIDDFWKILERQGITLFAERRFGKSSILRKMDEEGKDGFVSIYKHIEGISSTEKFVEFLLDRVKELNLIEEGLFKKLENTYNKATEFVDEIEGIKIKKLEHPWQKQLYYLFTKLQEKHETKKIVIMLDEFSIFLNNLSRSDASSVIGFLRNICQDNDFYNIRFIYCGSIGIDLVLDKIKGDDHIIGDPLNHMYPYTLLPFNDDNALHFGKCLNFGCALNLPERLIKQINKKADNIPYFIDIVFDKISRAKKPNQQAIDDAFEEILDDTSGKESINHFYDRIDQFYPKPKISIDILNFLSKNQYPSSESDIASYVSLNTSDIDRIEINKEINKLMKDGYLNRSIINDERFFDFKYSLLKAWWKRNKAY
jgi:hypothetical protein